jgi:adenylate cyclase
VRGFTSFSEKLEPEVLMLIINQYLSVASDAINLYEGVVDKYVGDAVTGLFNTQLNPQTDHALRAVRAALSMKYDVLALHDVLPPEQRLLFGIGIHTGHAVLGNVGSPERREFAAIGDALEFSKLLQENAGKGEIMLSDVTYQQVKDYFDCEALTPGKLKGRTDFTVMYRVNGVKKGKTSPLIDFE